MKTLKMHIERILGIKLPDHADFRLKKDGTIKVQANDMLDTFYRVEISPYGEVRRSRQCGAADLRLTLPAKFASPEMRMRYPGRKKIPFCYDYTMRESAIISCERLHFARMLIGMYILFTTGRIDALLGETHHSSKCAVTGLYS